MEYFSAGTGSNKVVRGMPEWTKETKSVKCEACTMTLNSQGQAYQHWSGKAHAKKLKILEASKQTLKAPVKQEEFQSSNGNGAQVGGAEAVSRKRSLPLSIPCDVCKTTMNNEEQASAHFAGSKHAKKAKMEAAVPTSLTGFKIPKKGEKELVKPIRDITYNNLTCTVCKITFNAQSQADAHYAGSKHAKKVKMDGMVGMVPENNQSTPAPPSGTDVDQPPIKLQIGQFHCHDCNITLNAQGQYDQHCTGTKHIKNANKTVVEGGQGQNADGLYCDACKITVKTPQHLKAHLEGNNHKENQKKMEVTMNYTHENL